MLPSWQVWTATVLAKLNLSESICLQAIRDVDEKFRLASIRSSNTQAWIYCLCTLLMRDALT